MTLTTDIANLQANAALFRTLPCTITRGGVLQTGTPLCRVMPSARFYQPVPGSELLRVPVWEIYLPPGTDVRAEDVISVATLGTTYGVTAVLDPRSFEVERLVRCYLLTDSAHPGGGAYLADNAVVSVMRNGVLLRPNKSVLDTFTVGPGEAVGEDISLHHGEIGATWTNQEGSATGIAVLGANGMVRIAGITGQGWWYTQYVASGIPPNPDYTVQASILFPSMPSNDCNILVFGRALDAHNYYAATATIGGAVGSGLLGLNRLTPTGWVTPTIATVPRSITIGVPHTLALVMAGTQLTLQFDGVTVLGPVTDVNLSATGQAGFGIWVNAGAGFTPAEGAGPQIDNFEVAQGSTRSVYLENPTRVERIMAAGADVPALLADLPDSDYQNGDVITVLSVAGHTVVPHPQQLRAGVVERLSGPPALTSVQLTGIGGFA